MASIFERRQKACESRRAETRGQCEIEDCIGLGWCKYVYDCVPNVKRPMKPAAGAGTQEGSSHEHS
jgi:hypothetical protein